MVIIVFGLPGSGKSYFATQLAARLGALYASTDELRKKMFPIRTYSDAEKLAVYDAMLNIMVEGIHEKKTIVLDGTFYTTALRDKFEQAVKALQEKLVYIEVTAAKEIIEARLEKPRLHSEANLEVYQKLKKTAEPLLTEHLVLVSTNDSLDSMLAQAIHYIDAHR